MCYIYISSSIGGRIIHKFCFPQILYPIISLHVVLVVSTLIKNDTILFLFRLLTLVMNFILIKHLALKFFKIKGEN